MRLFKTPEHECSYYPERRAVMSVLDPHDPTLPERYGAALAHGFRRTGGMLYKPMCSACRACVATRLTVTDFRPSRSQRRTWQRNRDVQASWQPPLPAEEHRTLYRNYVQARHGGEEAERDPFESLTAPFPTTLFLELRLEERLVGLAITDRVSDGLSAVYTAYDTTLTERGLGTLAILHQMAYARAEGLQFLYLGFWLDQHPQMDYKRRFVPQERLIGGRWLLTGNETPNKGSA